MSGEQKKEVLDALLRGEKLTTWDIMKRGIMSPTKVISDLRKDGVDIQGVSEPMINKNGKKIYRNVYSIIREKQGELPL